jgi:hypothetical protein
LINIERKNEIKQTYRSIRESVAWDNTMHVKELQEQSSSGTKTFASLNYVDMTTTKKASMMVNRACGGMMSQLARI